MDIFDYVSMEGVEFGLACYPPPWGFSIGVEDYGVMYLVEEGHCWIEVPNSQRPPFLVRKGGLVALSAGQPHRLSSDPEGLGAEPVGIIPLVDLGERDGLEPVAPDGVRIFSTRLRWNAHALAGLYPAWAFVPPENERAGPLVRSLAGLVEKEVRYNDGKTGTPAIIHRFAECIVIAILRHLLECEEDTDPAWRASSADRYVAKALGLLHENPEMKWSVDSLAQEVGLGRSAFYERFNKLVGKPPIQYLTELRIRKAATAIQQGRLSLGEIAINIGYESEAAFNRAFQRQVGMTPGRYRAMVRTSQD